MNVVSESPAVYAAKQNRRRRFVPTGTSVVLHGVSWETFERLIEETGDHRKARFAYDHGEFEIRAATQHHVILHDVSWSTYLQLIKETGDSRKTRFAYDNGKLEIMAPYFQHEASNRPFELFMLVLAEELGIDFLSAGSLLCNCEESLKGIEPDTCFYVKNAKKIAKFDRSGGDIDFKKYPPPDLMIEIEMTNTSLHKLPICAALGVPEHWRYDGEKFEIRVLKKGGYVEVDESLAFPGFPFKDALPGIIKSGKAGFVAMTRNFRQWVRTHLQQKAARRTGKKRL